MGKLYIHRVAAKFVQWLLTKAKRKPCSNQSKIFYLLKYDASVLKNIITCDETWVYGYDVKTKTELSQ